MTTSTPWITPNVRTALLETVALVAIVRASYSKSFQQSFSKSKSKKYCIDSINTNISSPEEFDYMNPVHRHVMRVYTRLRNPYTAMLKNKFGMKWRDLSFVSRPGLRRFNVINSCQFELLEALRIFYLHEEETVALLAARKDPTFEPHEVGLVFDKLNKEAVRFQHLMVRKSSNLVHCEEADGF